MTTEEQGLGVIEKELEQYPVALVTEFKRAAKSLDGQLTPENLQQWAAGGLDIARLAFRTWEAASEYFKASAKTVEMFSFPQLIAWGHCGKALAEESPLISIAFFKASPGVANFLPPYQLSEWAQLGRSLYKGTWKSTSLSVTFFELSPRLLRYMNLSDMKRFVPFIDNLAQKSYDLANECLNLADRVVPSIDRQDLLAFFLLTGTLLESNWRDARNCFEAGGKVLGRIEKGQRSRFLRLAEQLARVDGSLGVSFFMDVSRALEHVELLYHAHLLDLSERLLPLSPLAVNDFLRNSSIILGKVRGSYLELWFQEGLKLLQENRESGHAYFRLESTRSEELLETLSCGVELEKVRELLGMYSRALAGDDIQIIATSDITTKGMGWSSLEKPLTEGTAVFLPSQVERYESKEDNFGWYKVMTTHQVAHQEFGSFGFSFNREGAVFPNLRRELAAAQRRETNHLNDLQKFMGLFQDRKLALDIFTTLEDGRTDYKAKLFYGGLRPRYNQVQQEALMQRPSMESLPLREALVELLMRLSVEDATPTKAPQELLPHVQALAFLIKSVQSLPATVEDSAEATIRIYQLLSAVPNISSENSDSQEMDTDELSQQTSMEDVEEALQDLRNDAPWDESQDAQKQPYHSPKDIEYRGEIKPELAQLLANAVKNSPKRDPMQGQSPNSFQRMREPPQEKPTPADATAAADADLSSYADLFVDTLLNDLLRNQNNLYQDPGYWQDARDDDQSPLHINEPMTFLYDEWDFRAGDYKPRWCCVREKTMEEGSEEFYNQTLESYAMLASQIKRHFEMISPETLRKVKRLPDGEEFDLDAVVDSIVQRRSGSIPTDKVYWRRNKVQRDVAMGFLLDMSASTAEAIEENRRSVDHWDPPDSPRDYLLWLRSRREDSVRRSYKRIIDVEKESVVLLIRALETIGDKYGIYGFSGYGRENVEFYSIKDLDEALTSKVKRRIDRIMPLHATRMGPAIRHATTKLEKVEAKTKILFLLSDGRPQDRGYSREGVEKEYAVHDTKQALIEARRKNINPFCLTVDRAGHDYLRTMCQDMGYEIVEDITSLPRRLPLLYKRLTV